MPEGFFSIREIQSKSDHVGKAQSCVTCGLYQHVLSPKMGPFGDFKLGILNIGEAPGETEDQRGKQWQGKVGQTLRRAYDKLGVGLFTDCLNINAINCRPTDKAGNNRAPTAHEITCCRPNLLKVIELYKPKVIVLLGGSALISVIGYYWKHDLGTISRWRGHTIPDRNFNAWVCPTFHPSFTERGEKEVETIWMQDLARALSMVNAPLPKSEDESKQIEIVEDLSFLPDMKGPVAFDFETTGLKPHNTTMHEVVCMAVCNRPDKAFAFMNPKGGEQRRNIRMFLKSNVGKIAQNMKFEHTWSQNLFNLEVNNWVWDTMLATHVLDNRPDVTGLKFQSYVQFGVADYDSGVSPYLKAEDSKNGNATNRILELAKTNTGRKRLLTYCGMDALFEYRLAMKQMEELNAE